MYCFLLHLYLQCRLPAQTHALQCPAARLQAKQLGMPPSTSGGLHLWGNHSSFSLKEVLRHLGLRFPPMVGLGKVFELVFFFLTCCPSSFFRRCYFKN